MVERSALSISAIAFIYFVMWSPTPTHERIHLQKATAVSLPCADHSWPGAWNCELLSVSPRPAVLGLISATQEMKEEAWTRSENCLAHHVMPTLACAIVSFFADACSLVSVAPWCCGCSHFRAIEVSSIHLWTQIHALTLGQVLGPIKSS